MIALSTAGRWVDDQLLERLRLHAWTFVRDAALIAAAFVVAGVVRYNGLIPADQLPPFALGTAIAMALYSVCNYLFAIHRRIWEYAGLEDVRVLAQSSAVFLVVMIGVDLVVPTTGSIGAQEHHLLPLLTLPAGTVFSICMLLGVRLRGRMVAGRTRNSRDELRVLIVGAGQGGHVVAADLLNNSQWGQRPVGFLDDDRRKRRMRIHGLPVLGTIDDLPDVVAEQAIDVIGVAIPSASTAEVARVLALAQETDARILILPSRAEALIRNAPMRLRDLQLNDLLQRPARDDAPRMEQVRRVLEGRTVLVTGAAGSIGSEICKQALRFGPAKLLALDNNESGLFYLHRHLLNEPQHAALMPILADITDETKMENIFRGHEPDIVLHAAAYKHVPILEFHPEEATLVNVLGTANLCRLAERYGCGRFVNVSTDKAVQPINVLGFSKRIGELIVRAHGDSAGIFCSVRFGNVIGSRGSALPEFVRQIDAGGPVTVTHPDVERYFMTIPEAVSLVIQAGAFAQGGELFMLDMGKPVKLVDLVHRIIRMRGLRIGVDIAVTYTGLRPGEKLSEELVFDAENVHRTENPAVFAVEDGMIPDLERLEWELDCLRDVAHCGDPDSVRSLLAQVALREEIPVHASAMPAV